MLAKQNFLIEMQKLMDDLGCRMSMQEMASFYARLSLDLDDNSFMRAVNRLRESWEPYGKKYPSIADFLRAAKLSDEELELIANEAYQIAKSCAISKGAYISPDFEDILIANVIDTLGGWVEFHDSVAFMDRDDTFVRKDFVKLYKSLARTRQAKNTKLVGRNVQIGYEDKRVLIASDYPLPYNKEAVKNQLENKSVLEKVGKLAKSVRV